VRQAAEPKCVPQAGRNATDPRGPRQAAGIPGRQVPGEWQQ